MNLSQQIEILNRIVTTILVNDSQGRIEVTEVVKSKNGFKDITNSTKYNLKKQKISLVHSVIFDVREFAEVSSIKFFNINLFQRIFYNRKKKLLKKIEELRKNASWVIIPDSLTETFCKIDDLFVLVNTDTSERKVIFGNYDSFDVIINQLNGDYQVVNKNGVKVLELI
jgi:hypothetical protein